MDLPGLDIHKRPQTSENAPSVPPAPFLQVQQRLSLCLPGHLNTRLSCPSLAAYKLAARVRAPLFSSWNVTIKCMCHGFGSALCVQY